jgi:hypothetical protein
MKLITGLRWRPLQIEPFAKTGECAPTGSFECLAIADEGLESVRQKRAYGAPLLGSHHSRFAKKIGVELQGNVCFHDWYFRAAPFYVPDLASQAH